MQSDIALRLDGEPGPAAQLRYGQLVQSTQGRDAGKWYVVVGELTDMFTYVADGSYRTAGQPKRKNVKHLRPLPFVASVVARQLHAGEAVSDEDICQAITHITNSHEFTGEEDDDTGEARCDRS